MNRIPKILHYCFGMAEDFGGKPWSLSHHVCVASAVDRIKPDATFFYYEYEPRGPWWDLTKPLVTPVRITAPRRIFGRPVDHPAHRADVVRLEALLEKGGIYLDSDVFVHRAFDDLLSHATVLGTEGMGRTIYGTANAVILAEPEAPFLRRWYNHYDNFRGSKDRYWSEHSVQLPNYLAKKHRDEVTILGPNAFFHPIWLLSELERIFNSTETIVFPETYATHLWDGRSSRYTRDLTPGDVRRNRSNFHDWALRYLDGLPDDYGARGPTTAWSDRLPSRRDITIERLKQVLYYDRRYQLISLFPGVFGWKSSTGAR